MCIFFGDVDWFLRSVSEWVQWSFDVLSTVGVCGVWSQFWQWV